MKEGLTSPSRCEFGGPHSEKKDQNNNEQGRGKSVDRKDIGKDESAYCRHKHHWKKECPSLKKKETKANVAGKEDSNTDDALTVSLSVSHIDE